MLINSQRLDTAINAIIENDIDKYCFINKVKKELEQSYKDPEIKIAVIARNIAISERQLYRFFKKYLNITPNKFIMAYRLEKAFNLLIQGESLGNVAFDVGFSSHSYFSRCFKNKYGTAPSEIQNGMANNHRQDIRYFWQNFNN